MGRNNGTVVLGHISWDRCYGTYTGRNIQILPNSCEHPIYGRLEQLFFYSKELKIEFQNPILTVS